MVFYCKYFVVFFLRILCFNIWLQREVYVISISVTLELKRQSFFWRFATIRSEIWSFFQIILFCGCWNVKEVLSFVSLEHVLFYALLQMRGLQICAVMFAAMCVEVLVQTLRGTWGSITPQHWQNCNVFVQLVISFFNLWTQVWNNMTIQGMDYMLTKPRGKLLFPILTQLSY